MFIALNATLLLITFIVSASNGALLLLVVLGVSIGIVVPALRVALLVKFTIFVGLLMLEAILALIVGVGIRTGGH